MPDSIDAPLMAGRQDRDDELDYRDADEEADVLPASMKHARQSGPSLFVWLLTFAAGISGLLFGYDTGVISATLVKIDTSLSNRILTTFDKSIITSSTALFALLVSPFSSIVADALGRKRVIFVADILFILGALMQAWAGTVTSMVIGRSIVGLAVGAASFVVPLYIAELAPASHRGRLVTMNVLFITLGQVVAYIIGWAFAEYGDQSTGWRWMVGLGALPAALQCSILALMPESPRWLVMVGQSLKAKKVVERVLGNTVGGMRNAEAVIKEIEIEIREEREVMRREGSPRMEWWGGWQELFSVGRNKRALVITCLLQGLQQLCGFNSLMYFSATIFKMVGFGTPTLTAMSVAVTNFIFTVAALCLIDRIGRRKILLYSLPFMIAGLMLSAYGFSFGAGTDRGAAVLILVSIMGYVAAYALGLGNVPWMQSELFPLAVRSIGSGVSTATNWGANFVVGLTFLPLMDALSPSWTFVLYALVCLVGYGLIWRIYPETSGLSLEEATNLLENGWGVRR
ncbi:general substrate transporter [Colletotrichum godetiae]|uniref:General substrate transporter n=1 Tax=Colletotrichum godetiae TaxID=1209918 RepID=A0AAJ0AX57_9PEZI|nr:general substrate transporter [Colletotrichum godetiae]KAK1689764.1 general substrate transporter [Colletotrichum godetiae]